MNAPLDSSSRSTADGAAHGPDNGPAHAAPGANAKDAARTDRNAAGTALASSLTPRRAAELNDIFAADGLLARQIDGYRSRASQIEMARAVAAALEASGRAMPEPAMFDVQQRPARRLQ